MREFRLRQAARFATGLLFIVCLVGQQSFAQSAARGGTSRVSIRGELNAAPYSLRLVPPSGSVNTWGGPACS